MNRRIFCMLPFAGALAAFPATADIIVYDLVLTREKVAVVDLDGKTYGLRWAWEWEQHFDVDVVKMICDHVEIFASGKVTVKRGMGAIPKFENINRYAPRIDS